MIVFVMILGVGAVVYGVMFGQGYATLGVLMIGFAAVVDAVTRLRESMESRWPAPVKTGSPTEIEPSGTATESADAAPAGDPAFRRPEVGRRY